MKVSVLMITYGHEKFIRQAIESVLNQECNFNYELVVANDCSPDSTDEIIVQIIKNHSKGNIIKYIKRPKNIGMQLNYIDAYQKCEGKYIANCEGDDYWTDSLKLQKQVDILESNPLLVGCFHNSEERYWNDYSKASSLFLSFPEGREVSIQELTQYNMVPTASIVFKRLMLDEVFTEKFSSLPIGDWPLHLLNTRDGNYYYLPQVMSVRNLNPQSVWGMQDHEKNVAQVVRVYNDLIESGWFDENTSDLLKKGREKLENSVEHKKDVANKSLKRRVINKIIHILNKIK